MRIWCVRPVSSRHSTSEKPFSFSTTVTWVTASRPTPSAQADSAPAALPADAIGLVSGSATGTYHAVAGNLVELARQRGVPDDIGKAALFLSNDAKVLELLKPREGNLAEQLSKETDARKLAESLFLSVLTRSPTADEAEAVTQFVAARKQQQGQGIELAIWALLSSTEFCMNH